MKRQNLIFALCLGMAVSSCTKDDGTDDFTPELVQMTISAGEADADIQTKVGYDRNGSAGAFKWSNGDAFSFFSYNSSGAQANNNRSFSTTSTTALGTFQGEATTWDGTQNVYAVYPYTSSSYTVSAPADLTNATATFTLPNPQTYTVGGSLNNAFMVAATNTTAGNVSMSFKQVMSIIKFDITNVPSGETVTGVSLDILSDFLALSGTAKMADATLSAKSSYTDYHKVNVTGATAGAPTTVQMVLFPVDISNYNVNIIVYTNAQTYAFTKRATNFERNERTSVTLDLSSESTLTYPETSTAFDSKAVRINGVWWSPLNLGVTQAGPYGLYHQWGRSQGVMPSATMVAGPTSYPQYNYFYMTNQPTIDWFYGNMYGTWDNMAYTFNDNTTWAPIGNPCPRGWRVCSTSELTVLMTNMSSFTSAGGGYPGKWYSGSTTYSENVPRVFLVASPTFTYYGYWDSSLNGWYWTNERGQSGYANAGHVSQTSYPGEIAAKPWASGLSVRCVKKTY